MTERTDQRICIKFSFNLGKSCTETIEIIQKVFVDENMGITQIKEWYRRLTSTSKSEPCQVNADYLFRLWEYCALRICSKRSDGEQRILRWIFLKIAWCREKITTTFLVKRWLASSPRQRASAYIEPCAAIFGKTQDCTPSQASVQFRHSSLRLLDVPKIENGAQRKAVRRHRDDSE